MPGIAAQVWSAGSASAGCIGYCPRSAAVSQTRRSSYAKRACGNTPDATKLFDVLRLVLCTQPRSQARQIEAGTANAGVPASVC
jgi:hypothetical protein